MIQKFTLQEKMEAQMERTNLPRRNGLILISKDQTKSSVEIAWGISNISPLWEVLVCKH